MTLGRIFLAALLATAAAHADEAVVVDGVRYVCRDGMCVPEEASVPAADASVADGTPRPTRLAEGYLPVARFLPFLEGEAPAAAPAAGLGLAFLLALLGGLALNLTPCVLPLVPVNLVVIGRSPRRGLWYALGIALAYGALGLVAVLGGAAFGSVQSSPWFNAAVAVVFAGLGLSLFGVWGIDFSRFRPSSAAARASGAAVVFALGATSAVLAGACVAPVLVSVLVLATTLYAQGRTLALALPFALGAGMALPWPLLAAGLRVLPRPGRWMAAVNRVFALALFALAFWSARTAWRGFRFRDATGEGLAPAALPARLAALPRPVFVSFGASWCKSCGAMDRTTLADPAVRAALSRFSTLRVSAEDFGELRRLPGFETVKGLPVYAIYE